MQLDALSGTSPTLNPSLREGLQTPHIPPTFGGISSRVTAGDIFELGREALKKSFTKLRPRIAKRNALSYPIERRSVKNCSIDLKYATHSVTPRYLALEVVGVSELPRELKYLTSCIAPRFPPQAWGGYRGVEVPPSGRDLGWEKNVLLGIREKQKSYQEGFRGKEKISNGSQYGSAQ